MKMNVFAVMSLNLARDYQILHRLKSLSQDN